MNRLNIADYEYYLGLDIGTSSLGWAVTDPEYNILECRGKAMWGVHLFEEGKTAAERRMHRCARRRLERRKQRVALLRELFDEEVCKIDPSFFQRLDESGLHVEDKTIKQSNSLFNDKNFTDKEFHSKFPTVYHLRKFLMETDEKPDIRLVYLALHHIIKYRGHFIFSSISSDSIPDFKEIIDLLIQDVMKYGMDLNVSDYEILNGILTDRNIRVTDRKRLVKEALGCSTKPESKLGELLAGAKVKPSDIFEDDSIESDGISFSDNSIEDKMAELEDILDEDQWNTLRIAKQVYNWSVLSSLLKGHRSISYAKIASYEQHRSDLALLKKAVRKYASDMYKDVFKSGTIMGNYCSYSGKCGKIKPEKSCNQEEFCKFCLSVLSKTEAKNDPEYNDMMMRLSDGTFMPKQTSKTNSVFPYTIHKDEMVKILENASRFYPFLKTVNEDGLTTTDKVIMIQGFRIPYYVGPLNTSAPMGAVNRSWAVRRSNTPVRPWNFDDVVDREASAEAFMENLTSMCTYMIGEKVLPKNSIVYSYFTLFNELNNIRVNGDRVPVDIKKRMVSDLFENPDRKGRVTKNAVSKYLVSIGVLDGREDAEITGMDNDIKTSLRPLTIMKEIIGQKANDRDFCEEIIRIVTVFEEAQDIRRKLKTDFGDRLTDEEIGRLAKLGFEGWGRLSKRFLTGLHEFSPELGRDACILDIMENTQYNLMEVLSRYGFEKQIEKINQEMTTDADIDYGSVDRLYVSPAVKRGIWRTVCVAKDVMKFIGHPPKKVFVETTRQNIDPSKKKRTESRKNTLIQLYKACREDPQWLTDLESRSDADLKSRNMYLYYTQLGRCMYCGRKIDIEELGNTDSVDRDHIYPQSLIKDDSIHNNLVLSCKKCNSEKSNKFPIAPEVQMSMKPMWDILRDKKYITSEKYSRLVRKDDFSQDELSRFISRQLVETSQSVKGAVEILGRLFGGDTEIVYVKAGLVSEFRQNSGSDVMIKCRSINDYHHAKDAYLNIVVGNVYDTKFTKDYRKFIDSGEHYNLSKMYDSEVSRSGNTAWIPGENGSMRIVLKNMRRNNILFTKQPFVKKGAFFDDNLVRAKGNAIERKRGMDTEKYGGYNKPTGACYSLVEYKDKKRTIRSLEVVPVYMLGTIDKPDSIRRYHSETVGKDVEVIIPVIRLNTLFEWNGFRMHIGGRTGDSILFYNAVNLLMDDARMKYCKILFKFDSDRKDRVFRPAEYYGITQDMNMDLYDYLAQRASSKPYEQFMTAFCENLHSGRIEFEELDCLEQASLLNSILLAFHCNNSNANLKAIKGSTAAGRIQVNKKLPDRKSAEVFIINQSPSGLWENKVRIN